MYSISVVLPAHNEAENIARVVKDADSFLKTLCTDYEILVVDDGSVDSTAENVCQLSSTLPVRLLQHERNQGYGAALWTGIRAARKPFVFWTDADNQFTFEDMRNLLALSDEAHLVIGHRIKRQDPPHRLLFAWGWNTLVNLLFGHTAKDVDCAFKLARKEVIDAIEVQSRGATFSAELLVRAKRAGFGIREVGVRHFPRTHGSPSGAKPSVILRAFRELWRFRLRLWQEGPAELRAKPPGEVGVHERAS